MIRLIAVEPLERFRLRLRYAGGVEGVIDLSANVGRGVFTPLADAEFFRCVHLGQHSQIVWSDEIEICPDAAYTDITGRLIIETSHVDS